jgi:hypothetical protein
MTTTPFVLGPQVTDWIISEGKQSSPQQADREVYENAAEAVGTTQGLFFGFRVEDQDDAGNPITRLCKAHADDGASMSRLDHLVYMQTIMNTGVGKTTAAIGAPKNKGVGARIATLAHNLDGMDVYARTPAEAQAGEAWHLVRLMQTGIYEFDVEQPDGSVVPDNIVDAEQAEIDQFPPFVRKAGHGVVVVFRGDGVNDNWTVEEWKKTFDYMQSRYYDLPTRVWVDGESIPLVKTTYARSDYRYEISSLSDYYAKHTGHRGVSTLSDGTEVEWFVFDRTATGKKFDALRTSGVLKGKPYGVSMETGPSRSGGFRGVALRDGHELFNHSQQRFSTFNIIGSRATSRCALIITPAPGLLTDTTNRQQLVGVGGSEIPWLDWGQEFGEDMPTPIKELMDTDYKASDTISAEDLDRLDPDWHKRISSKLTHVVNPDGSLWVEPERSVVAREGSSGGSIHSGPGPHNPSPNPGPLPGNQAGTLSGSHNSTSHQLASRAKPKTRTSVKGSQQNLLYLDLKVTWLPDVPSFPGEPTWGDTVTDAEAKDKGWAWFPGGASKVIYLRKTGDPFVRTLGKYLDKNPLLPRPKVQDDVQSAYGIEAMGKVVYVKDAAIGWTSTDVQRQFDGLHLSFALAGLNSVEDLVESLLRKTVKTATSKPTSKKLKRKKP